MSSSNHYSETYTPKKTQNYLYQDSWLKSKNHMPSSTYHFNTANALRSDSITEQTFSTTGKDSYDFHKYSMARPNEQRQERTSKSHRRTYQSTTTSEKQPVVVRKSKSLRENTRSKLRSPPPPPKFSKSEIIDKLPSLFTEKKQSIKRHPSLGERKKSITHISSNNELPTVFEDKLKRTNSPDDMTSVNKAFAEYQGYSRHSRHRSFTYSPPPRTSSLTENSVPAVPPVPKLHTSLKSRSSSLKNKKSDSKTSRPTSDTSNTSNVNFYQNGHVSELQKALDRMLTDLPERSVNEKINQDLAQIEENIKALALERSSFIEQKKASISINRKRGKVGILSFIHLFHVS